MSFNTEDVWNNLTTHRVLITQKLRVDRNLLFDYLQSKLIFDTEDCELVHAEKTTARKAGKMLDILLTKGKESLVHFLDVLQLTNPGLYEKLTGQKATTRLNPIFNEAADRKSLDIDPVRDLDILSNHLKRAVTDLQEMTLRYEHMLKENQKLSKHLSQATSDLDLCKKQMQCLEKEMEITQERAREAHNNTEKINEKTAVQMLEYQQVINDQKVHIIVLQMKLLSAEEDIKQLRNQTEKRTLKNDKNLSRLKELSQNFEKERRESIALSEKLANQRRDTQELEKLRNAYVEIQKSFQELHVERDQAFTELEELKNWTQALKARYDIVERSKKQDQKNYEQMVTGYSLVQKELEDLKFQLSVSKRQEMNLKKQNEELSLVLSCFQQQRDVHDEARKEAIKERDEAKKGRDEIFKQYHGALKRRDEAIKRHAHDCKEFENRLRAADAELQALRDQLAITEEELRRSKMNGSIPLDLGSFRAISKPTCIVTSAEESLPQNAFVEEIHDDHDSRGSKTSKTCTDIISSIRRRIQMNSDNSNPSNSEECPLDTVIHTLSRLPFQTLTSMFWPASLSPRSPRSPSSESSLDGLGFGSLERLESYNRDINSFPDLNPVTNAVENLQSLSYQKNLQSHPSIVITQGLKDDKVDAPSRNGNFDEQIIGCKEQGKGTSKDPPLYNKTEAVPDGLAEKDDQECHKRSPQTNTAAESECSAVDHNVYNTNISCSKAGPRLQRLCAIRRPRRV